MLEKILKASNTNYLLLKNGNIIESNIDIKKLEFNKDYKFVLIHNIDSDTVIKYDLFNNVHIEILELLNISNDCNIKKVFNINDNSTLDIISIEASSNNSKVNINIESILNNNSTLNNMKITLYQNDTKILENSIINNSDSNLSNYNVYINTFGKLLDINSKVTHKYKDSESIMTNYGICKGGGKITINTDGVIEKGAKRTVVRQKSKGILLDLDSTIEANPWLEIDEYDCMANHGAGIGAIDEEELYYLMSRGLTRLNSEKLIIGGYVNPVIDKINELKFDEEITNAIKEFVNKYL